MGKKAKDFAGIIHGWLGPQEVEHIAWKLFRKPPDRLTPKQLQRLFEVAGAECRRIIREHKEARRNATQEAETGRRG